MSISVSAVSNTAQPNYPIMVNGYLCFSAADAQAARDFRGLNRPLAGGARGTVVNMFA